MRKVSKTRKFKAFICSYSGTIALLGVLLLVCQILFSMYLQGSSTYGEIEKITSPIVMSFVASVIFYFISFYLPKVRINEINSKEIEEFFRRLEHLNTYTLISLGLGASRFYKEGIFKYPTLEAVKMVSEGQTIHDKPDIDCWEEDEIYEKLLS